MNRDALESFINTLSIAELFDLLCMTEAFFGRHRTVEVLPAETLVLIEINDYLRSSRSRNSIETELKRSGLLTSPDYARHGLTPLLG